MTFAHFQPYQAPISPKSNTFTLACQLVGNGVRMFNVENLFLFRRSRGWSCKKEESKAHFRCCVQHCVRPQTEWISVWKSVLQRSGSCGTWLPAQNIKLSLNHIKHHHLHQNQPIPQDNEPPLARRAMSILSLSRSSFNCSFAPFLHSQNRL